jgi:cytochrome d ubiquinol oxidase subunit I
MISIFNLDLAILSRIQFAFTIGFHIIWPTITIGLALFLLIFEVTYLRKKDPLFLSLYKFWVKVFALAFGIGVVTGIPLSYQFGTNFSSLTHIAGGVLGPLISVEVMTAFFLEAAFIGVMVFGLGKVHRYVHLLATFLVALGTHHSAFWIITANSWMHTPAGYEIIDKIFVPTSWSAIIFNPSMPYRLAHALIASYISAALLILGISGWYLLKKRNIEFGIRGLKIALVVLLVFTPLQVIIGDLSGINVLKHQPVKIAAMEGLWETKKGVPLVLFGIPDTQQEKNHYTLSIPKLTSFILTHDFNGEVKGLKHWPKEERPPVSSVFYGFRLMVGLGFLFLLVSFWGLKNCWFSREPLYFHRWYLRLTVFCIPLGIIATITGWIVAETGRQPYVIYGLLKTKDALSPVVPSLVAVSLIGFVFVYFLMFVSFVYYFIGLIKKGPEAHISPSEEQWLEVASHSSRFKPD